MWSTEWQRPMIFDSLQLKLLHFHCIDIIYNKNKRVLTKERIIFGSGEFEPLQEEPPPSGCEVLSMQTIPKHPEKLLTPIRAPHRPTRGLYDMGKWLPPCQTHKIQKQKPSTSSKLYPPHALLHCRPGMSITFRPSPSIR